MALQDRKSHEPGPYGFETPSMGSSGRLVVTNPTPSPLPTPPEDLDTELFPYLSRCKTNSNTSSPTEHSNKVDETTPTTSDDLSDVPTEPASTPSLIPSPDWTSPMSSSTPSSPQQHFLAQTPRVIHSSHAVPGEPLAQTGGRIHITTSTSNDPWPVNNNPITQLETSNDAFESHSPRRKFSRSAWAGLCIATVTVVILFAATLRLVVATTRHTSHLN